MYETNTKKVIKSNMAIIVIFILLLILLFFLCYQTYKIPSVISKFDSGVSTLEVFEEILKMHILYQQD